MKQQNEVSRDYVSQGLQKFVRGQLTESIIDFNKALFVDDNNAEAYLHRGNAKTMLKEYTEAIQDYTNAINIKPDFTDAIMQRGNVNMVLGIFGAAIDDFDTVISMCSDGSDHTKAEAYYCRGCVKWGEGYRGSAEYRYSKYEDAINDFNEALRLMPNHAEARGAREQVTKALYKKNKGCLLSLFGIISLCLLMLIGR